MSDGTTSTVAPEDSVFDTAVDTADVKSLRKLNRAIVLALSRNAPDEHLPALRAAKRALLALEDDVRAASSPSAFVVVPAQVPAVEAPADPDGASTEEAPGDESKGSEDKPTSTAHQYGAGEFATTIATNMLKRAKYSEDAAAEVLGVLEAIVTMAAPLCGVDFPARVGPLDALAKVFNAEAPFYQHHGHVATEDGDGGDSEGGAEDTLTFFEGWQSFLQYGDQVDFKHPATGKWVVATIQGVNARQWRVSTDTAEPHVIAWVDKTSPGIAPGGTYSQKEAAKERKWRKELAPGQDVDVRVGASWRRGKLTGVRNCSKVRCAGSCQLRVQYTSADGSVFAPWVERYGHRLAPPGNFAKSEAKVYDAADPADVAAVFRGASWGGGSQHFTHLVQALADAGGFDRIRDTLAAAMGTSTCANLVDAPEADGEPCAEPVEGDADAGSPAGEEEPAAAASADTGAAPFSRPPTPAALGDDGGDDGDSTNGVADSVGGDDGADDAGDDAPPRIDDSLDGGGTAALEAAEMSEQVTGDNAASSFMNGMAALSAAAAEAEAARAAAAEAAAAAPRQVVEVVEVETSPPAAPVSAGYVSDALGVVESVVPLLARPYAESLLPPLAHSAFVAVLSTPEAGLRALTKPRIKSVVERAGVALRRVCTVATTERIKDQFRAALGLAFVRCPLLERQLEGLHYLSAAFDKVDASGGRWLTPHGYVSLLANTRTFERIFSSRSHYELVKRSASVLKHLSTADVLTDAHLDLVWAARRTTDEATVMGVLEEMLSSLVEDRRNYLATLITAVPPAQVTPALLKLIHAFCRFSMMTPVALHNLVQWMWQLVQDGPNSGQLTDDMLETGLQRLQEILVTPTLALQAMKGSFLHRLCQCIEEHRSVPQALRLMLALLRSYPATSASTISRETRWVVLNGLDERHSLLSALFADLALFHDTYAADAAAGADSAVVASPAASASGGAAVSPAPPTPSLSIAGSTPGRSPGLGRTPSSSGARARPASLNRTPSARSPALARARSAVSAGGSGREPAGASMGLAQYLGMLQARFDFVAYVTSMSKAVVDASQVDAVWGLFIEDAKSPEERDLAFRWLSAACNAIGVLGVSPAFAPGATRTLFEHRLAGAATLDAGNGDSGGEGESLAQAAAAAEAVASRAAAVKLIMLSDAGFECLRRLFLHANACSDKIKVVPQAQKARATGVRSFRSALLMRGRGARADDAPPAEPVDGFADYQVLDFDLTGLEIVWRVVVDAQSNAVARNAMGLLKQLLDRLAPDISANVEQYRGRYVTLCMNQLLSARRSGDIACVGRCVQLLHSLMDQSEVEGLHGLRAHAYRNRGPLVEFEVTQHHTSRSSPFQMTYRALYGNGLGEDNATYIAAVHANDTVFQLRAAISDALVAPMADVDLYANGRKLLPSDNGSTISELSLHKTKRVGFTRVARTYIDDLPDVSRLLVGMNTPTPLFSTALDTIWEQYCDPVNQVMDADYLVKYFASCGVDETSWADDRLRSILLEHKHVKNEQGEPCLVQDGFRQFYIDAAMSRTDAVWHDLLRHGYQFDLRHDADVLAEEKAARADRQANAQTHRNLMPRYVLSHKQEYFDLLFGLLEEEELTADTWRLLMRLPTNPDMHRKLLRLVGTAAASDDHAEANSAAWHALLDPSSPTKLLYSLQIVEALAEHQHAQPSNSASPPPTSGEGEAKGDEEAPLPPSSRQHNAARWCHRFLKHGGFHHVNAMLMRLSDPATISRMLPDTLLCDLSRRCVGLLLKVVRYFLVGAMSVPRPDILDKVHVGMHADTAPAALSVSMARLTRHASVDTVEGEAADDARATAAAATPTLLSLSRQLSDDETFADKLLRRVDLEAFQLHVLRIAAACAASEHVTESAEGIVQGAAELWVACVLFKPALYQAAAATMDAVFDTLVVESPSQDARKAVVDMLCLLATHVGPAVDMGAGPLPGPHLLSLCEARLRPVTEVAVSLDEADRYDEFFVFVNRLLAPESLYHCLGAGEEGHTRCARLLTLVVQLVGDRGFYESFDSPTRSDVVLCGLLELAGTLIACPLFTKDGASAGPTAGLSKSVFDDLLFARPSSLDPTGVCPPKCKTKATRSQAFRIVLQLARADFGSMQECLGLLDAQEQLSRSLAAQLEAKEAAAREARAKAGTKDQATDTSVSTGTTTEDKPGDGNKGGDAKGDGKDGSKVEKPPKRTAPMKIATLSEPPALRSSTGFAGLRNLGCTCYMNSLLQQMYMIPAVRYGLTRVEDASEDKEASQLTQLQRLFARLEGTVRRAVDPRPFVRTCKDEMGRVVNVMQQHDAQEFFNVLCDRLETQLKATSQANLLKRVFGGTTVGQLICHGGCGSVREREEGFFTLELDVKGNKDMHAALAKFVEGEIIQDYRCDTCGKSVETHKRSVLQTLPNTLVVHLKRFEFNLQTFVREKLNSKFEFPQRISLADYTKAGVEMRTPAAGATATAPAADQAVDGGDGGAAASGQGPDAGSGAGAGAGAGAESAPASLPHPDEYYEYELAGVVQHMGTAESGHYYSYIRPRPHDLARLRRQGIDASSTRDDGGDGGDPWFEFNDTTTRPFSLSSLEEQCFGGSGTRTASANPFSRARATTKPFSAYILVYERVVPQAVAGDEPGPSTEGGKASQEQEEAEATAPASGGSSNDDTATPGADAAVAATEACPPLETDFGLAPHQLVPVLEDNDEVMFQHLLCGSDYYGFVGDVMEAAAEQLPESPAGPLPAAEADEEEAQATAVVDMCLRYVVGSLSYLPDAGRYAAAMKGIKTMCARYVPAARVVLASFCDEDHPNYLQLERLLLAHSNATVRQTTADALCVAVERVAEADEGRLTSGTPPIRFPASAVSRDDVAPPTAGWVLRDHYDSTRGYASQVARLVDRLLELMEPSVLLWQRHKQYWELLARLASGSSRVPGVRATMVHRGYIATLCDLLLGDISPFISTAMLEQLSAETEAITEAEGKTSADATVQALLDNRVVDDVPVGHVPGGDDERCPDGVLPCRRIGKRILMGSSRADPDFVPMFKLLAALVVSSETHAMRLARAGLLTEWREPPLAVLDAAADPASADPASGVEAEAKTKVDGSGGGGDVESGGNAGDGDVAESADASPPQAVAPTAAAPDEGKRACGVDDGTPPLEEQDDPPALITLEQATPPCLRGKDALLVSVADDTALKCRMLYVCGISYLSATPTMKPVVDIIAHTAWEWPEYSLSAIEVVLDAVFGTDNAANLTLRVGFSLLEGLFNIDDSLREMRATKLLWDGAGPQPGMMVALENMRHTRLVVAYLERVFKLIQASPVVARIMADRRKDWVWVDAVCKRPRGGLIGLLHGNPMKGRCQAVVAELEATYGPLYQPPVQQQPLITELTSTRSPGTGGAGGAGAGATAGAGTVSAEELHMDRVFPEDCVGVVDEKESRVDSGVRTRVVQIAGAGPDRPPALVWRVRNYNSTAVEYTLRVTACVNAAFSRPKECVVITLPGNTANNDLIRCIKRDEALDIDVTWTVTVKYLDEQAAARTPERRIRPRQVTPEEVSMMPGFGSSLQGWQPPTVAFADDPFNVKGRNAGKTSEPRPAATTTGGVATSPAPAPSPTPDTAAGEPTGEAPAPAPAPADAGAPSPASSEWSCSACTFLNPAGKEVCTICFTPNPDAMRRRLGL